MEKENLQTAKKGNKVLVFAIVGVIVAALLAWVIYNGIINEKGVDGVFGLPSLLLGIFIVVALGYLLGRITIKGVNLGTAGVFLVAILFGYLCLTITIKCNPVVCNNFLKCNLCNLTLLFLCLYFFSLFLFFI